MSGKPVDWTNPVETVKAWNKILNRMRKFITEVEPTKEEAEARIYELITEFEAPVEFVPLLLNEFDEG
jgi:hypothetical protein